jgi:hypothetical protein
MVGLTRTAATASSHARRVRAPDDHGRDAGTQEYHGQYRRAYRVGGRSRPVHQELDPGAPLVGSDGEREADGAGGREKPDESGSPLTGQGQPCQSDPAPSHLGEAKEDPGRSTRGPQDERRCHEGVDVAGNDLGNGGDERGEEPPAAQRPQQPDEDRRNDRGPEHVEDRPRQASERPDKLREEGRVEIGVPREGRRIVEPIHVLDGRPVCVGVVAKADLQGVPATEERECRRGHPRHVPADRLSGPTRTPLSVGAAVVHGHQVSQHWHHQPPPTRNTD